MPPSYAGGTMTLSYINTKTVELDNMTAIYTFSNGQVNQTVLGTLGPSPATGFKVVSGLSTRPINLKITATNCEGMFLADTAIA